MIPFANYTIDVNNARMKFVYFLLLWLIGGSTLYAQSGNSTLTGYVGTGTGGPYAGATLTLLRLPDSALVKIEISDPTGLFRFEKLDAGSYLLRITAIAMTPHSVTDLTADGQTTVDIGRIVLEPAPVELEAVEVTASTPIVTMHPDRNTVNVDQLLSSQSGTVLDILRQSPGVAASNSGQLSIRGKSNVTVLIDGRRINLEGEELIGYLEGMPAAQLAQVEVITRPSARYDAQGTGGVINLKTKRALTDGINGNVSVSARQGHTFSSINNIDINWKRNNLNVLFNYGYVHSNPLVTIKNRNVFLNTAGQVEEQVEQAIRSASTTVTHTIRTGLDYTAGKTGIGFNYQANLRLYPRQNNTTHSDVQYPLQGLSATHDAVREREARNPMHSASVYLTRQLAREGASLAVVADYLAYDRPLTYFLTNDYAVPRQPELNEQTRIRQRIPSDIDIFGAKIDLSYPFSETTQLEAGVKSTLTNMDNHAAFELYDNGTGSYVKDAQRSSHYLFNENINAAYVDLSQQFGEQWELQAGLRLEHTRTDGEEVDKGERFNRHYTQLFPSASVTFYASENHEFTASVARRVNRPNYEHQIPFAFYTDLLYYQLGNPGIAPEIDFNTELSYTLAGKFTTTASYSHYTDVFIWTLDKEPDGPALVYSFGNISRLDSYSLSLDYMDQPAPWYTVMASVTGEYERYRGLLKDEFFDAGLASATVQLLNQFRIGKGWAFEVSGQLFGKYQDGPFSVGDPYGLLNVTIAKQVLQGKGSVRISGVDILDTYRYNTASQLNSLQYNTWQRTFNQQFGISFSYRFGTGQRPEKPQPTSSTAEEAGRL